jgi:hypothetical protein
MPMTPAEFTRLIADETDKWAKVIRRANLKPVANHLSFFF